MSEPKANYGKAMRRGFDLALRVLGGERIDVCAIQRELNVSRATAYRYWRVLRQQLVLTSDCEPKTS